MKICTSILQKSHFREQFQSCVPGSNWRLRLKPLLQVAKAESEARFTDPGCDFDSKKIDFDPLDMKEMK